MKKKITDECKLTVQIEIGANSNDPKSKVLFKGIMTILYNNRSHKCGIALLSHVVSVSRIITKE